jgi:hypothetical protein
MFPCGVVVRVTQRLGDPHSGPIKGCSGCVEAIGQGLRQVIVENAGIRIHAVYLGLHG